MKLRIRGNSVRIRVSQSELAEIAESGTVEDTVEFAPGARLSYRVDVEAQGAVSASFVDSRVSVRLPRSELRRWLEPSEVSVRGQQPIGEGRTLQILLEKDFTCLAPVDEDQSDMFPNPGKKT